MTKMIATHENQELKKKGKKTIRLTFTQHLRHYFTWSLVATIATFPLPFWSVNTLQQPGILKSTVLSGVPVWWPTCLVRKHLYVSSDSNPA